MTWWQQVQQAFLDGINNIDRTLTADFAKALDSGATTPAEQQRELDRQVASIDDPAKRAEVIAALEEYRTDLEAMLEDSGRKDLESMTIFELQDLATQHQATTVDATGTPLTDSAQAAGAAAQAAGGNIGIDNRTGAMDLYDDSGKVHERLAPGEAGRPAQIVAGEITIGSEPGGPRPVPADVKAAIDAIRDASLPDGTTGAAGLSYNEAGDVTATFPDGSIKVFQHDDLRQMMADLQASSGRPADIADALNRGATQLGEDAIQNFNNLAGSFGWPGLGGTGGGTPGMGGGTTGAGTGGGGSTSGGGSRTETSTRPGSTSGKSTWDSSMDTDSFDSAPTGSKPSGSTNSTGSSGTPATGTEGQATATPPATDRDQENTFMTEEEQRIAEELAIGAASDDDDDDDENTTDDSDGGDGDGSSTDTEYTPAPDGENRRDFDENDLERMAQAAAARAGWSDRTAPKAPEYDPEFAARMQDRKLGLIGNPGDPDQDMGTPDGQAPARPEAGGFTGPDDDTGKQRGHDLGHEDPMLDQPQGTLDPSILDDDEAPALAPQEMAVAELDPALVAPLATSVEAEVNIEGTPEIPDYHYALGDPVSSAPPPEQEEAIAARSDPRLGGQLSIASTFRLPTKDADDDPEDA